WGAMITHAIRLAAVILVAAVVLTQHVAVAKGPVDAIEFSGPALEHDIAVTEGDALLEFSPWGQAFLGEQLDSAPTALGEPLAVTMYLRDETGALRANYRFAYHPRPGGGAIRLPGRGEPGYDLNKTTILSKGDGQW